MCEKIVIASKDFDQFPQGHITGEDLIFDRFPELRVISFNDISCVNEFAIAMGWGCKMNCVRL